MLIENNFAEKFQKDSLVILLKIKLVMNIPYPKIFYIVVLLKFRVFEYKSNYDTFIIFGSNYFINCGFIIPFPFGRSLLVFFIYCQKSNLTAKAIHISVKTILI